MKKAALILITVLTTLSLYGQEITGQWNGILKIQGIQLRIVFNIEMKNGKYVSTMDSPDQGAKGIPVTTTSYKDATLIFKIASADILYEGSLNEENNFVGIFNQAGLSLPLDLTREQTEKEKTNRPQEPIEPFPYYSEDVKFENSKDNVELAGTLTLPKKDGIFPVVVLISGSGPQNRDEEIFGHKPFLVLADHLTKKGIAVLRFDDRGTGESTGNFQRATSIDFAGDVKSAVEYLKTRTEINKNKIGLIGHSEGGIIAPMVAAELEDINFIVLMAGTGISGDKLLLLQQELISKASGMSETQIEKTQAINKGAFDIIVKSNNNDSLKIELTNYIKKAMSENPESGKPEGMSEDDYINLQLKQLTTPWMTYFLKHDPAIILEKVKCNVLAINGEKDLQVPAKINLEAIKSALEKGGNKNITIKELSNLNHLFQECETGLPNEYGTIEQTFSPVALEEITTWILSYVE